MGYILCEEMDNRYYDAWDVERTYDSLDEEELPTDTTRYYGVLCGLNRGTLENIRFEDRASVPEMNLYPNENDTIDVGIVCARNEGTISGVDMLETSLRYRTFDKYTPANVGIVCGYQTADAVLESVRLDGNYVDLDSFGEAMPHVSPSVNAGILIGEAEGGATVGGDIRLTSIRVGADYSLADQELRLGGLIGRVRGDIQLTGLELNDVNVRIDARTDQEGYTPGDSKPLASGGLVGWTDGSVTLSDILLTDAAVDLIRREGGDPFPSYTGGFVAYCGGDLTAQAVSMGGDYSSVDASVEQGEGYAGGLCGYCAGAAEVTDSTFTVRLSPWFSGRVLYEASVLGYVCGSAVFNGVQADAGVDEYTGESNVNSIIADSNRTFYLAALAGAAEGKVTAENCVIDVHYSLMGTPGALYSGGDDGVYNAAG